MRLTLENPTTCPRRDQWVTFTMPPGPTPGAAGVLRNGHGRELALVAGIHLSPSLQLGHVRADVFAPAETFAGEMDWSIDSTPEPFEFSDWIAKSKLGHFELLATVDGCTRGITTADFRAAGVECGPVRRVSHLQARIPGTMLLVDLWVYFYARQDFVPFELLITCSDPRVKDVDQPVDLILLRTAEFPRLWTGKRRGAGEPVQTRGWWETALVGPTSFGDAQALGWYGSFLVQGAVASLPEDPLTVRRREALQSELQAPMVAMVDGWGLPGAWGPFGSPPRLPADREPEIRQEVIRLCRSHGDDLARPGDPWDSLPFGLSKLPGDVGDQQGFGLSKCVQALGVVEPLFLLPARYCAFHALACRPRHMREADGSLVRAAAHPKLVTWSEYTHYHWGVSLDRLGKDNPDLTPNWNGWGGMDDQHYQPIFEVCTYALTGSWAMRYALEAMAERLLSQLTLPSEKPGWSTNGMGAARAVGRMFQSMAWLDWALGGERLMERAEKRTMECVAAQWAGRHSESWPIRVLAPEWDPRLPGGVGWRPPFEAMGVVGLYLVWRKRGNRTALMIAHQVLRTLVRFGVRDQAEPAWGLHYRTGPEEGQPLTEEQYRDPDYVEWGGGDWPQWSVAAFQVGVEIAAALQDQALGEECRTIVAKIRAQHGNPADFDKLFRFAEWTIDGAADLLALGAMGPEGGEERKG